MFGDPPLLAVVRGLVAFCETSVGRILTALVRRLDRVFNGNTVRIGGVLGISTSIPRSRYAVYTDDNCVNKIRNISFAYKNSTLVNASLPTYSFSLLVEDRH